MPSCVPWSLLNELFLDHAPLFAMDLFPALFARKPKGSSLTSGCHSCHQEHTMETHLCTRCWDGCKKRKTCFLFLRQVHEEAIESYDFLWSHLTLFNDNFMIYDWSSTWFPKIPTNRQLRLWLPTQHHSCFTAVPWLWDFLVWRAWYVLIYLIYSWSIHIDANSTYCMLQLL